MLPQHVWKNVKNPLTTRTPIRSVPVPFTQVELLQPGVHPRDEPPLLAEAELCRHPRAGLQEQRRRHRRDGEADVDWAPTTSRIRRLSSSTTTRSTSTTSTRRRPRRLACQFNEQLYPYNLAGSAQGDQHVDRPQGHLGQGRDRLREAVGRARHQLPLAELGRTLSLDSSTRSFRPTTPRRHASLLKAADFTLEGRNALPIPRATRRDLSSAARRVGVTGRSQLQILADRT